MEKIGFSLMQLIEESQHGEDRFVWPNVDSFDGIPASFTFRRPNFYYEISVHKHTDYIWFYFSFGNPIPRDERERFNILCSNPFRVFCSRIRNL